MTHARVTIPTHARPTYENVATQIAAMIQTQGLKAGDRLPTERELGVQLDVSRTVIREAVKALSAAGLIRSRQGSGNYVNEPPHPFASAAIDLSMPVDPAHVLHLFEFRLTIEAQTAEFAAERITPRELLALEEVLGRNRDAAHAEDVRAFLESDAAFHRGLADATHNGFYLSAVTTIFQLQRRTVEAVAGVPGSMIASAGQHRAILDAIGAGDQDASRAAMQTHLLTATDNFQQEVRRRLTTEGA